MNDTLLKTHLQMDWRERFMADQLAQGKSPATAAAYGQDVAAFERWFELANEQPFTPELINSWDLRGFRSWSLEAAHVSPATWNRRRASLTVLCAWLRAQGVIAYDPMEGVGGYQQEELAPRWLDKSEFGRVMRQLELNLNAANTAQRKARALRDGALVAVMAYAGLREGEACALLLSDVDLGARRGRIVVRLGKGQKQREVPVSSELRRWLGEWLKQAAGPYLFGDERALTTRAAQKRVAELGEQAGVNDLTPHRLRHSCAKRMVDSGAQLTAVQKILGHAKIETTARYTMAGWEDLEEAVEGVALGKTHRRSNG